jgi:hypothetical protein
MILAFFIKHCQTNQLQSFYVDDLLIFADTDDQLENIINHLKDVYKEVTSDIGVKHSYLGMTFLFKDGQVNINMDGYIQNLIVDIKGTSTTPAGVDLFIDEETTLLPAVEQKELAKLLFLATRVHPDILLVVNYLTTRVNKFTANDKKKCKRCLKYLHKTKELGLVLTANDLDGPHINNHTDASFGVHRDGEVNQVLHLLLEVVLSIHHLTSKS